MTLKTVRIERYPPFRELDGLLGAAGTGAEDPVLHHHLGIGWTEPQRLAEGFPSFRSTPVELMDSGKRRVRCPNTWIERQGPAQIAESVTLQLGAATGVILVDSGILVQVGHIETCPFDIGQREIRIGRYRLVQIGLTTRTRLWKPPDHS